MQHELPCAHHVTLFLLLFLQSAKERSSRWWNELSTHGQWWRRPEELAAAVRSVTQAQVIAFSELLAYNASSVSSWIVPSAVDPGAQLLLPPRRSLSRFRSIFRSRSLACLVLGAASKIEAIDCIVLRGLICRAAVRPSCIAPKVLDQGLTHTAHLNFTPRCGKSSSAQLCIHHNLFRCLLTEG
jgi:hypothetical protein